MSRRSGSPVDGSGGVADQGRMDIPVLGGAYLLLIGLATFGAFAFDKARAARGGRRLRERTLLTLAALGGTPGALLGQALLRHKTRKQPFVTWLWFIMFSQVFAAAVAWRMLS
jgi:uncharacterized membrane protein YsdA (DUF1294 family)